jgi:hypothetical protein
MHQTDHLPAFQMGGFQILEVSPRTHLHLLASFLPTETEEKNLNSG